MEFFDKLGKKATEAYKLTADKTGKIAKETKMKLKIGDLKSQISDLYEEIGKKVYEKHIREENISIKEDLEEECTKIDVLSDEIDSLLKTCLELKNKKQCPKCFTEIEMDDKYCPNCGEKQTDEPEREVQIIEKLENTEVEEDNKKEKEIVMDNLKDGENEETENNLEKTVEIESNVNLEDEENNDN